MSDNMQELRINAIIDDATKALEAEGVAYVICVIDKKQDKLGVSASELTQKDWRLFLGTIFNTKQKIIQLGLLVGNMMSPPKDKTKLN
jgi:hypothetical protein